MTKADIVSIRWKSRRRWSLRHLRLRQPPRTSPKQPAMAVALFGTNTLCSRFVPKSATAIERDINKGALCPTCRFWARAITGATPR